MGCGGWRTANAEEVKKVKAEAVKEIKVAKATIKAIPAFPLLSR
jgi:hypothetical protein